MKALILVDLQNDFFPHGAFPVKEGDSILPVINKLLEMNWDSIIATKDWHPKEHGSFAVNHKKESGDVIILDGLKQILWPVHCVQNTSGSDFAPGWDTSKVNKIFHKGTDVNIDSYSTFFDNGHRKFTGLEQYLHSKNIQDVYLAGLATEYCVKYSAMDSKSLGFNTFVVIDGCRGINLKPDDSEKATQEMKAAGIHILHLKEVERGVRI